MLKLSSILRTLLSSVTLSLLLAAGTGCKDSSQSQGVGWQPNVPFGTLPPGFDSFPERWNKQVNDRLAREEAAKQKEIKNLRDQFFKEEDPKIRESCKASSLRMKRPSPSSTAGRRKETTSSSRLRQTSPRTLNGKTGWTIRK